MAKYAVSGNASVSIDDSNPTARDVSAYARSIDVAYEIPALDVTGLSDSAERVIADIQHHPEFSVEFVWDDTADTGSWTVIKGILGSIGTVTIFPDGTLGLTGEALCVGVTIPVSIGNEVRFTARFRWDGSVTVT